VKKPYIYPANKQLISEDLRIDELPAIKIWGRRCSDGREGWFFFSAVKGSYHSVLPEWIEKGDEVEFFEPLAGGAMRSLTLPGIRVGGGSVSRLVLEGGNILLFSNIAGVHQSFYLLNPDELDDLHEIIVDTDRRWFSIIATPSRQKLSPNACPVGTTGRARCRLT
jgi:hypothetical protein